MILALLGDVLSPPECAACAGHVRSGGVVFCSACAATVVRCENTPSLVAFGHYGGALATAIQRFKYGDCPHLARPLGGLVGIACRDLDGKGSIVVPVPLHPRRLALRGYNQSALLAGHVAAALGAKVATNALFRIVDTSPQAELSRARRELNVAQVFRARSAVVAARPVIVVDDVATTGATLTACRAALVVAGAPLVTSVVLARTIAGPVGFSTTAPQLA
ncbi:MAG TPA: ComF family protein [Polyangiaceae bacterium]|nr:ComF family protein [Polyangiaceae bacterium]